MPTNASFNPPSIQKYIAAFRASDLTDNHIQILQIHYNAPEKTITAKQLTKAKGYQRYQQINSEYGRLADLVGKKLNYCPEPEKLSTFVTFEKRKGEWHWILRDEVAKALESLKWVSQTEFFEQLQVVEAENFFNPENLEDARQKVIVSIARRQGQPKFRRQLLTIYEGQCAITRCDAEPALEAAHIVPYKGKETNTITNGLLLRADVHTLFDLHLLSIEPKTYQIVLGDELMKTAYKEFSSRKLFLPKDKAKVPNQLALTEHYQLFLQKGYKSRSFYC